MMQCIGRSDWQCTRAHRISAYLLSLSLPHRCAQLTTGGAITRAMVSHMSCVFPTASFHAISCSEIFADDVVKPCSYQDVHAGFVRVTDAPGLGVQIDYDALARLKRNVPDPRHDRPWIARSVLRSAPSPTYMYHLIQPSGRERDGAAVDWYRSDGAGGPPGGSSPSNGLPLGFNLPISTDYWDEPESEAAAVLLGDFTAMKRRIQEEGSILIKGAPQPRL